MDGKVYHIQYIHSVPNNKTKVFMEKKTRSVFTFFKFHIFIIISCKLDTISTSIILVLKCTVKVINWFNHQSIGKAYWLP